MQAEAKAMTKQFNDTDTFIFNRGGFLWQREEENMESNVQIMTSSCLKPS